MWCVPELTAEFIERMEDVLRLYARKLDPVEPVVCLDERPVVLREDARRGVAMKPGRISRRDYEYVRCGTANIFCIVEPLAGRRLTFASADRKPPAYVRAAKDRCSLPTSEAHSSRPRQPQYSFPEVGRSRARRSRRSSPLAPLRSPLHPQARELAERRGDRGEPRLPRMPRTRSPCLSGRPHLTRRCVAPSRRRRGAHHRLDLSCR